MDDQTFASELARLRQLFLEGLPQRLERIREAWTSVEPARPEAFERFYREVHNLAGACESYGLVGLGQAARAIERKARPFTGRTPSQVDLSELGALLEKLAEKARSPWRG